VRFNLIWFLHGDSPFSWLRKLLSAYQGCERRVATFYDLPGIPAPDPEVLRTAAEAGRVLVSRDVSTMPRHFAAFIATRESPGLILIPPRTTTGEAIEGLLFAWLSWTAQEMRNQLRWLPL